MPVGLATSVVPGLAMLTVAVKVTLWPETQGLVRGGHVVVVLAWLTTWLIVVERAGDDVAVAAVDRRDRVRAATAAYWW